MQTYECTITYHPDTGEDAVKEQLERSQQIIASRGGEVSETHAWGVRELAYPIQKQKRGIFYVLEFQGGGDAVSELERNLRIADPVIRYVTIAVDPDRPALELSGSRRDESETASPEGAVEQNADLASEADAAAASDEAAGEDVPPSASDSEVEEEGASPRASESTSETPE